MRACPRGRVLVTDAQWRNTLAIVRSLGRKGISVRAGFSQPHAVAFSSKYCSERLIYPCPKTSPGEFLDFMLAHLQSERYDCFIPMIDEAIAIVARHREKFLEFTNLVVVDGETMELARNKRRTIEFAQAHGFACPRTFIIEELGQLERIREEVPYPAVIKPRVSDGAQGLVFVERSEELLAQYHRVHRRFPFPMVQECVPPTSPKYQVCCLFNRQGEVRAAVVQRLHRQYPVNGGTGTCFETVNRPDLKDYGIRLLKALGWQGVACVELLEDERDGVAKLMEINPRFWGTLALAVQAGVDFPYLYYRLATEGDVEPQMDYRVGEICRWMLPGEILHFLSNSNRWRLKPSFWRFWGGNVGYSILSREDLRPVLAFFWIAFKSLFDRKMLDMVFRRI